ncbi:MAG: hypothetical protein ABEJ31_01360 [Haloarculaceae archaeon]
MRRRRLLVGAASLAAAAGLAGCSGYLGERRGASGPGGSTPGETAGADGHRRAASRALATNNDAFADFAAALRASDRETAASFDAATVRRRVRTAQAELDRIRDAGDAVAAMRDVATAQLRGAALVADYATASRQYATVDAHGEAGAFDAALAALDRVATTIDDARAEGEAAADVLSAVDEEAIAPVSVRVAPLRRAVGTVRARVAVVAAVLPARRDFLRGSRSYVRASAAYEDGQYATAAETFADAKNRFGAAADGFDGASSPDGPGVGADVDALRCRARAFADAAAAFRRSATAYGDGDAARGDRLRRRARDAADRCTTAGN